MLIKLMPKKGFTLVELLVVISIIAILSVIGITLFSNVQKGARDAKRRADIDSIATAMEANYNSSTGQYPDLSSGLFSNNVIPTDPINSSSSTQCNGHKCVYCGKSVGITIARQTPAACVGGDPNDIGNNNPASTNGSWMVCANLETNSGPGGVDFYCKTSAQ